jgi:hypothetical protein
MHTTGAHISALHAGLSARRLLGSCEQFWASREE